ncbi:hypothetical protein NC653_036223 [Populus alba x Populus x berolinensis]|uniref:Uncharacterized protein n=1 Tax=Populus alba x Populus x berolinensis TaxID=444605 RepID=A0AAD6LJQ6_9ROSI|nr:hypothetical protein NC653_036223 [Populus alba x Populus x berolinensis]
MKFTSPKEKIKTTSRKPGSVSPRLCPAHTTRLSVTIIVEMKERNTTSTLRRVLVNCAAQAKEYGWCVAAKVPEIERDILEGRLEGLISLIPCGQTLTSASIILVA